MTNIVKMNTPEDILLQETIQLVQQAQNEVKTIETKLKEHKKKILEIEDSINNNKDKNTLIQLKRDKKSEETKLKLCKQDFENKNNLLDVLETDLGKIRNKKKQEFVQQSSQSTAEKVFDENNIHYVIFDQQWWSVDPAGGRMDVKINASEAGVIKDLIFNDSNWEISSEQELKKLAKEMGRMYKHIVRDFEGLRNGVYNQMDTIRKQWLTPIYDVKPHDSFRVLTLSIAGGDEDYADQLERFVAYRYCHPEDVMIPNIDSCAIGGTGRDTFYNLLRTIFTDECCGSVGTETFKGTHNGDLFGKMIIKVDEKDSHSVPIDKIKEFTGSNRYRHRSMQKDARDVARLFTFIFFRNGFTSTAKLAGTGTSGEDRRFEPIIARVNLPRHMAYYHQLITSINIIPNEEVTKAMMLLIKEWQQKYYKNEERIQEWLGHIITKFNAYKMTELLPLHGKYYSEMLTRQKRGIDGFMPKFITLMTQGESTIINITQAHKIYQVAESQTCTKDWFKNNMMYWLNTHLGWDSEEIMENVYTFSGCTDNDRRKMAIVQNKLSNTDKRIFNIEDFIDRDAVDEKGSTVGEKINIFSIRDELR